MKIVSLIAQILSLILISSSLVGYTGKFSYIFELFSHFKQHFLLLGIVLLVFFIFKHDFKVLFALVLIITLLNIFELAPWYLNRPILHASTNQNSIKLITANIKFNNSNYSAFLEFIENENPDIIFMQELNEDWIAAISSLQKTHPHYKIYDPGLNFGVATFSKFPILNYKILNIGEFKTPSLITDIKIYKQHVKFINIHPMPPISPRLFKSRNQMFEEVAKIINTSTLPTALAGDSNTTMWSPHYKKLLKETNLRPANKGFGLQRTWPHGPANYTNFLPSEKGKGIDILPARLIYNHPIKLPIDHVLISPNFQIQNLKSGPNIDSDHLPVIAEILF